MWYVLISKKDCRNWLTFDRTEQVQEEIERLLEQDVPKEEVIIINASCDETVLCVDDFYALLS